ncbi:MAG: hypothetical protein Q8N84_01520 [bacterium]|nr:hypothetical protein [bacterium]
MQGYVRRSGSKLCWVGCWRGFEVCLSHLVYVSSVYSRPVEVTKLLFPPTTEGQEKAKRFIKEVYLVIPYAGRPAEQREVTLSGWPAVWLTRDDHEKETPYLLRFDDGARFIECIALRLEECYGLTGSLTGYFELVNDRPAT